jgi:TetR/AcrR family transcriptional regulator
MIYLIKLSRMVDFSPIPSAARHVLILGFLRSLVIPAHLQEELAPHLQTPQLTCCFN